MGLSSAPAPHIHEAECSYDEACGHHTRAVGFSSFVVVHEVWLVQVIMWEASVNIVNIVNI